MDKVRVEKVAAVVVTYNRKDLLRECLEAILAQTRPVDAIYVIDNASSDGTDRMIAEEYSGRVNYVRLPENTGGAGGFHHGMKLAYEAGYDWIWVTDDDVKPFPDCLENLVQQGADGTMAVLPVHVDDHGRIVEPAAVNLDLDSFICTTLRRLTVADVLTNRDPGPCTVWTQDFTFEGTLIARKAIDLVGLPLRELFLFFDDTEFSLRIRRVVNQAFPCTTTARVTRAGSGGRSTPAELCLCRQYYGWRNMIWFTRHYARTWRARQRWVYLLLRESARCVARRRPKELLIVMAATLDGLGKRVHTRFGCFALPSKP